MNSQGSGRSRYVLVWGLSHFRWRYWWLLNSFKLFSLLEQGNYLGKLAHLCSLAVNILRIHPTGHVSQLCTRICVFPRWACWEGCLPDNMANSIKLQLQLILNLSLGGKKTNSSQWAHLLSSFSRYYNSFQVTIKYFKKIKRRKCMQCRVWCWSVSKHITQFTENIL